MGKQVMKSKEKGLWNRIKENKEFILVGVTILITVIAIVGTSYAVFTSIVTSNNNQTIRVGTFEITFTEGNTVKLENASPITDAEGLALTPYNFTIKNSGNINAKYRVKLEEDTTDAQNLLPKDKIKIAYSIGNTTSAPRLLSSDTGFVIDEGVLQSEDTINYSLRLWLDESAGNEVQGKTFKAKLVVEAVQYTIDVTDTIPPMITLNGNLVETIQKGSAFTDSGVLSVKDDRDQSLSVSSVRKSYEYYDPSAKTTTTVGSIDTSKVGIYYIYYRASDTNNNEGLVVRTVNVIESQTPPTITLSGSANINIALNSSYTEPGYSATDKDGANITDRVVVTNVVNSQVVGNYVIKYLVVDKDNNIASATRIVTIKGPYKDSSGANAPNLVDGLIPVVYDGTNWVSADTSSDWYAYGEQRWANAVTTTATNRAKYQTPGTIIPMSDINTMWVWIPRYEYKFSNMAIGYAGGTKDSPGAIGINFIAEDVTAPSDAANYKVHPAFTFGTDQLAGIWVGKFETGNQTSCTATNSVANSACDLTTLGVQVKPNVPSWRGIRVSTAFTVSREMSNAGNVYGLNNGTTDSHMMKNTEWGAVAYLSESIYGKYGNSAYSGANKEVYINNYWNNSQTLTGCSAGAPSTAQASTCAYTYEKPTGGTGASTTGNIYGVYDMSGGAYEYVMGNMKANGNLEQQSGYQNTNNYNSGFTGVNYDGTQVSGRAYPAAKYYDAYNYSTSNSDHSTCYIPGDATYEVSQGDGKTNGWYSDYAYFVATGSPWFYRGGYFGDTTNAGVFNFYNTNGSTHTVLSFRLVLSVTA